MVFPPKETLDTLMAAYSKFCAKAKGENKM
jgi:hypothetical protein